MISSKGIVIFAYNSTFDYVKIASVAAALAKRETLGQMPATLITDEFGALAADRNIFDKVIIHTSDKVNNRVFRKTHDESTELVQWKNLTRADVYDLTPYEQTLLLDADYLMFNSNLFRLFYNEIDFTCYKKVFDVTGRNSFNNDERLSQYSIESLWATAIYFRKSEYAESVFEMMKSVKANYQYYSKLYGFKATPYRNDFALSVAHHALSGYRSSGFIPYSMPMLSSTVDVVHFDRLDGTIYFQWKDSDGRLCSSRSKDMDMHIMNKDIFTDKIVKEMLVYATTR